MRIQQQQREASPQRARDRVHGSARCGEEARWALLSPGRSLKGLQAGEKEQPPHLDSCDLEKLSHFLKNPLTVSYRS